MPKTLSETFEIKGITYRKCGRCKETKILNIYNFDRKSGGFTGICKKCHNKRSTEIRRKILSDPIEGPKLRKKNRDENKLFRAKRKVWIPLGTQLASCRKCGNNASQGFYVYAHELIGYGIFYIGKGSGIRAWSVENRHQVWKTFVAKNLQKGIIVHLLESNISEEEALRLEVSYIEKYGRKTKKEGKLLNLDDGGYGPSVEVLKESWKRRKKDPEKMARVKEHYEKYLLGPEVSKKRITTREYNEGYKANRKKRLLGYSKDPKMVKKAMETRSKNPTWKHNIKVARKTFYQNPENLQKHRTLMQSDKYKKAHSEGIKKHHKRTRMFYPKNYGFPEGTFKDFDSRTEMCLLMGFNKGKVTEVIKGTRNHHRGFFFEDISD
jgi:hypothetical protein